MDVRHILWYDKISAKLNIFRTIQTPLVKPPPQFHRAAIEQKHRTFTWIYCFSRRSARTPSSVRSIVSLCFTIQLVSTSFLFCLARQGQQLCGGGYIWIWIVHWPSLRICKLTLLKWWSEPEAECNQTSKTKLVTTVIGQLLYHPSILNCTQHLPRLRRRPHKGQHCVYLFQGASRKFTRNSFEKHLSPFQEIYCHIIFASLPPYIRLCIYLLNVTLFCNTFRTYK